MRNYFFNDNIFHLTALGSLTIFFTSCSPDTNFKERLRSAIKEDPSIVFDAIEQDPEQFMTTVQKAARKGQEALAKKREEEEKKKLEAAFEKPLEPIIRADEAIRGKSDAPITLVEYSDFECPFCSRGSAVVQSLREKYKGKIRFIYKHLPLSNHPNALITAKYYEAIRLQSKDKAFEFHDEIFKQQNQLRKGEEFLNKLASKLELNMERLKNDVKSEEVAKRINQDMDEAAKFEMSGTPGFILNGIPIRGAYPLEHFVSIIQKLEEKGKLII